MKKNNSTSFIIISGIIILMVFAVVITINLLPNKESNSYYVKVDDKISGKIDYINIDNGKLYIKTSGNAVAYCVKSTRTEPKLNSVCWNKLENNEATISIFSYKKYYIWIKDNENNISNYLIVNSDDNK